MIESSPGDRAEGLLLDAVTEDEESRITYYEGAFSYHLTDIEVEAESGVEVAACFYPMSTHQVRGADWSLSDWVKGWGEMAVGAARDVMARLARYDA